MKKLIYLLAMVMFVGITSNSAMAQEKKGEKVVCFKSSMDCAHCETTIYEQLRFEKGIKDLKVDHASNTIMVTYKDGKNTDEELAKAVEKKGYKAEKITKEEYDKIVAHTKEHGNEHSNEQHKEK